MAKFQPLMPPECRGHHAIFRSAWRKGEGGGCFWACGKEGGEEELSSGCWFVFQDGGAAQRACD